MSNDIIGQEFYNNFDEKAIVLKYNDSQHILIKSTNGFEKIITKTQLKNKNWKTPFARTRLNKGYIGIGNHSSRNKSGNKTAEYKAWNGILARCYDSNFQEKQPTYKNCSVCEEWLCFQNFAEWYNENKWDCGDEILAVDKDFIIKGNQIYSPKTCLLIPTKINSILTKANSIRGDYPIGVEPRNNNKFRGVFNIQILEPNKRAYSKFYDTPEEAFNWYKQTKEKYIKDVADLYKSKYPEFPQKLYDAMYSYKVEITD